jgi:hypothetical protein
LVHQNVTANSRADRYKRLEFPRIWRVGKEKYGKLSAGGFMDKSQPTYTKEFKQQAVQLFETSKKSTTLNIT